MARRGLIRGHADFRRLWIGETVSEFGGQVSMLAMPLTAVLILHASTFQVSVLSALQYAPLLVFGLLAGLWVDRTRRRSVLIAADLLSAALLVAVPVAAAVHVLSLALLYVVQFGLGLGATFFGVAYQSLLPTLIGRERLVEGNSRLEGSRSVAYAVGPSIAGYLVQALTAPVAMLADAASFVWSAAWLVRIRGREPAVPPPVRPRAVGREIGEGLRLVSGHPVLRALALYSATTVVFFSVERAIEVVFLVRAVSLSASGVGLLFSAAGVGAVLGAFVAGPLGRRFGSPRVILGAGLTSCGSMLLVPLTGPGARLAFFAVGTGVSSLGVVVFNIVAVAFRQQLCPDRLLGRMNATMRFLSWGAIPLAALIGGAAGTAIGLRTTLWLAGAGGLLPVVWLVRSPLPRAADPAGPVEVPADIPAGTPVEAPAGNPSGNPSGNPAGARDGAVETHGSGKSAAHE